MRQEKEQDDPARSLPALFIHDSLEMSIAYSGNSESELNKNRKQRYGERRIFCEQNCDDQRCWENRRKGKGSLMGATMALTKLELSKVSQDFALCQ